MRSQEIDIPLNTRGNVFFPLEGGFPVASHLGNTDHARTRNFREPVLLLALLDLVRFLRMLGGLCRVSRLSIEFRQSPVDRGAARIETEGSSILLDRLRVQMSWPRTRRDWGLQVLRPKAGFLGQLRQNSGAEFLGIVE